MEPSYRELEGLGGFPWNGGLSSSLISHLSLRLSSRPNRTEGISLSRTWNVQKHNRRGSVAVAPGGVAFASPRWMVRPSNSNTSPGCAQRHPPASP